MRSTGRPQGPVGEIFEDELGNLYEWVEGVDGLGNPIGFWKQIKTAGRTARAAAYRAGAQAIFCPRPRSPLSPLPI